MPISYKVIGRHIRDARKSAGLTQEAAANQLGLSPEHYGKVERGERTVNLERMVADVHIVFLPFYPYHRGGCPGRNFSLIIAPIL